MEHKNDTVDLLLKKALSRMETPDEELIQKVKYELNKEESNLRQTTIRRSFSAVAVAVVALALVTTTAFAAWHFLKPSEIAGRFEDHTLSAAFESETAVNINASVTSGDYIFTLLAIVSGRDITDHPIYSNGEIRNDRTYAVTAIQKADGSPMPASQDEEYGNPPFYVSPYIKGLKPWEVNAHTMNGGYSEIVADGVMYRILDCDEITMFADRGVYLGINTGAFYDSQAFIFDEQKGELKANPDYDGASVIFDLPLDKKLANQEKAEQYLNSLNEPSEDDDADESSNSWDGVDWEKAVTVASTVKELKVDADGMISYTYDFEHGSGTVSARFDEYFKDNQTAQSVIVSQMASDETLFAVRFSKDKKGVITGMIVMPK